jgi:hypothetical protein
MFMFISRWNIGVCAAGGSRQSSRSWATTLAFRGASGGRVGFGGLSIPLLFDELLQHFVAHLGSRIRKRR